MPNLACVLLKRLDRLVESNTALLAAFVGVHHSELSATAHDAGSEADRTGDLVLGGVR